MEDPSESKSDRRPRQRRVRRLPPAASVTSSVEPSPSLRPSALPSNRSERSEDSAKSAAVLPPLRTQKSASSVEDIPSIEERPRRRHDRSSKPVSDSDEVKEVAEEEEKQEEKEEEKEEDEDDKPVEVVEEAAESPGVSDIEKNEDEPLEPSQVDKRRRRRRRPVNEGSDNDDTNNVEPSEPVEDEDNPVSDAPVDADVAAPDSSRRNTNLPPLALVDDEDVIETEELETQTARPGAPMPESRPVWFVEHSATGVFKKVGNESKHAALITEANKMVEDVEGDESAPQQDEDWSSSYQQFTDNAQSLLNFIFFIAQGLLAGLCFQTLFAAQYMNNPRETLIYISPQASTLHRTFYLLTSFAVLAAVNMVAEAKKCDLSDLSDPRVALINPGCRQTTTTAAAQSNGSPPPRATSGPGPTVPVYRRHDFVVNGRWIGARNCSTGRFTMVPG